MTANPTYRSTRTAELPGRFRGPQGFAWAGVLGDAQDAATPRLRVAALSRLPHYAPDDALDLLGGWLNLQRYTGEANGTPETGYRGRLCAAWPIWIQAGSKQAVIDAIHAFGIPNVIALNKYEYDPGDPDWYTMIRVDVGPDFGATGIAKVLWGDVDWGVYPWGVRMTGVQFRELFLLILKWKWAWALPDVLVLNFDDATSVAIPLVNKWGNDIVWGGFVWGNNGLWP